MKEFHEVVIEKDLFGLGTDSMADYIAHIFCEGGVCDFVFNERQFGLHAGDCAIITITKLVYNVKPSDDFVVTVIYVHNTFLMQSSPESNYGARGVMSLYHNPVIWLDKRHQEVCRNDFRMVEYRLHDTGHHFYKEALSSALRSMFLDYFDFHISIEGGKNTFSDIQSALVMRFINMLESGEYKTHRDLSHYADKLCVTAKHLSSICKKVSGFPANYWINRFTIIDIQRYLKDNTLTLSQIADEFCFSSPAYFSRYVYNFLGKYPSQFREN